MRSIDPILEKSSAHLFHISRNLEIESLIREIIKSPDQFDRLLFVEYIKLSFPRYKDEALPSEVLVNPPFPPSKGKNGVQTHNTRNKKGLRFFFFITHEKI